MSSRPHGGTEATKVFLKFRDAPFGMFQPSFLVDARDGRKYRGAYLEFSAHGIPWCQLVLDRTIRGKEYEETLSESPIYAAPSDTVYSLVATALGKPVDITYVDGPLPVGKPVDVEID